MAKHPGGRPTKYEGDKTVARVKEYLASCVDETYQLVKTEGEKTTTWENKIKVRLPTIGGLASFLGVADSTIQEWEKKHKEFSVSLREVIKEQARRLLDSGLSGDYNSTIAKLILSANHGYKERSDHTSGDLPIPILNVQPNISTSEDKGTREED